MIPDGGSTTELNAASGVALPVGGYGRLPAGFAIGQTGFQRWQARDAGDRDRAQLVEELQRGKGTIDNQRQVALWQPSPPLEALLSRPIKQGFGLALVIGVKPLRRCWTAHQRQRPDALRPG